eukprot:scaffold315336_cov21-Prasinocladus_malaysianus.AAC.1
MSGTPPVAAIIEMRNAYIQSLPCHRTSKRGSASRPKQISPQSITVVTTLRGPPSTPNFARALQSSYEVRTTRRHTRISGVLLRICLESNPLLGLLRKPGAASPYGTLVNVVPPTFGAGNHLCSYITSHIVSKLHYVNARVMNGLMAIKRASNHTSHHSPASMRSAQ